jgi:hypothetical protein
MAVDRPIFIVAPPRCGTSLLYDCLASHPDVGHFNRANRKFPDSPRLAWWLTRLRVVRDSSRESRAIWFRFLGGRDVDVADARDATDEARRWYHERIAEVLKLRGARRYVSKLPAHSVQVPYLLSLFPDALFLQPIRDWRAVVASTMVKRARDFPDAPETWFGVHLPGWQEQAKRPPHLGAAWQYAKVHELLDLQRRLHPDRFLPIVYEALVARPVEVMAGVHRFCGLRSSPEILARLPRMEPAHERWRATLDARMLAEIDREFGRTLRRYEQRPCEFSEVDAGC